MWKAEAHYETAGTRESGDGLGIGRGGAAGHQFESPLSVENAKYKQIYEFTSIHKRHDNTI